MKQRRMLEIPKKLSIYQTYQPMLQLESQKMLSKIIALNILVRQHMIPQSYSQALLPKKG